MAADTGDQVRARSKRIGEDVEQLAVAPVPGLSLVPDAAVEWYDAVTRTALLPTAVLTFSGTCLVPRGTAVEVKAARESVSNGSRDDRPGYFFFKGDRDGQHRQLVRAAGVYLLAVYRELEPDGARELLGMLLVPAWLVDELLEGRWYDSGRREGQVAQLRWDHLPPLENAVDAGGDSGAE